MTLLVDAVKGRVSAACVGGKIEANNCKASLKDMPSEHVAVDLDCVTSKQVDGAKRADYVYVANDGSVAVIEIKKGSVDVENVTDQLQGGADIADERLLPKDATLVFRPVLVRGGSGKEKHERRKRKRNRIRFRGERYDVVPLKCGAPLNAAFL